MSKENYVIINKDKRLLAIKKTFIFNDIINTFIALALVIFMITTLILIYFKGLNFENIILNVLGMAFLITSLFITLIISVIAYYPINKAFIHNYIIFDLEKGEFIIKYRKFFHSSSYVFNFSEDILQIGLKERIIRNTYAKRVIQEYYDIILFFKKRPIFLKKSDFYIIISFNDYERAVKTVSYLTQKLKHEDGFKFFIKCSFCELWTQRCKNCIHCGSELSNGLY